MTFKKLLATTGAVVVFAGATVIGAASAAHAAPEVTVTPNSGLKNGTVVTVTYSGFSPGAPIAVGVCPTERVNAGIKGPGDCGRTKNGASKLTTSDDTGNRTDQITVQKGALGNATPPAETCPPCSIGVTNIGKASENASVELVYGAAKKQIVPEDKVGDAQTPPKRLPET